MSILKKPYEITVWEDVWDSEKGKFIEQRIGIIGADSMQYQGRAIEPNLTRNANGTKKFTFKMYKHFIDNATGEKVDNLFSDWLISERKVKLYYNSKWYDFIVKNISETTDKYLYSYQLEDALVQELSKNGFGVILDDSNNNNSGNVQYLAEKVLEGTDWEVEAETFVQTIEESLVYLQTKQPLPCYQIIDQKENDLKSGCGFGSLDYIPQGKTILGFYSSCTNKPYRFQFIYLEDLAGLEKDDHRIITNKDCQYYFDIVDLVDIEANDDPEQVYITPEDEGERNYLEQYGFCLPSNYLKVAVATEDEIGNIVVSGKYRGKRIGFLQQSKFIPKLNRYVNIYDKSGTEYYGYQHTEYNSPTLIQNVISGYDFSSTSGWTGSKIVREPNSQQTAQVENVYGYFDGNFQNAIDELENLKNSSVTFTPYLKMTFTERIDDNSKSVIINSCMYDNRISISKIDPNEEWVLRCKYLNSSGIPLTEGLSFSLGEYQYDTTTSGYILSENNIKFKLVKTVIRGGFVYCHFTVESTNYNEKSFKRDSQIRLCIQEDSATGTIDKTYYIEKIELFKGVYREDDSLILPESQGENIEEGVIDSTYYYFLPDTLDEIVDVEELKPEYTTKKLVYDKYKPVFNTGAEKIRSISAKESNYFNILQSIAETFEAWLDLEIKRDDFGGITEKIVRFKNYLGSNNYAGFRYGVNLKSIKRTHESKKIVTKLIVKDNKNEFAKNGFCTISRAGANPTGENYIYDFQYFHNTGMLNARRYIDSVYSIDGACGKDIDINHEEDSTNINGYFLRAKALNGQIDSKNIILLNLSKDLLKLNADLEIAKAGKEAAASQIEDCEIDFRRLTKLNSIAEIDINISDTEEIKEQKNLLKGRDDVKAVLQKYVVANQNLLKYTQQLQSIENNDFQDKYDGLSEEIKTLTEYKKKLNQLFYTKYSRFIQEGTWISEEYNDDEKYYADALSTMYNSCYPQVAYTFDVLELSSLPGYEGFVFELGDKTFAEDPEFFGGELREEVVITEIAEDLDDPSKNKIKVQNFKNQFQDLFQKITATTQQAQYNTGSYEKAAALAEATQQRKQQFFTGALDSASSRLANAGQQTVIWGADGITITKAEDASEKLRLVAGAILFSKKDENGQHRWVTGVTSEGISANSITTGSINTRNISIMDSTNELFRWDKYGISAFAYNNFEDVTSGLKKDRFVRFDQYGLYGIDGQDGTSWHATNLSKIDQQAKFALTWEGLKVTGNGGGKVHIGKWSNEDETSNLILRILDENEEETFTIDERGHVTLKGNITWGENVLPDFSLEDLTNILTDASDGIYYDSALEKICINASFIKAGALQIGGTGPDDAIFYANYGDPEVKIGGWLVSDSALYTEGEDLYFGTIGISKEIGKEERPDLIFKAGSNFGVTNTGAMYAFSGSIGGWEIGTNKIYSQDSSDPSQCGGMCKYGTGPAFWAGAAQDSAIWDNAQFAVSHDGTFKANIGLIGGFIINENMIYSGIENSTKLAGMTKWKSDYGGNNGLAFWAGLDKLADNWETAPFAVKYDGSIKATRGNIGGFNINNYSLYANNFHILTGEVASNEPRIKLGERHERYTGSIFLADTPDAYINPVAVGLYFRVPIDPWLYNRIRKEVDGQYITWGYYDEVKVGETILKGESTTWENAKWIIDIRDPNYISICNCNSDWKVGGSEVQINFTFPRADLALPFCVTEGGDLHAANGSFDQIISRNGKIGGWNINGQGFYVNFEDNKGFGIWSTAEHDEIAIHAGRPSNQIGSAPFRLKHTGELFVQNHYSGTSDLNKKKDVNKIPIIYENFFDMIQPITFRFKENSSERIHTGFIAQQIKDALDKAGIDTKDFAGLVIEKEGEREDWYLRYGEFISLNTWQIQKLKFRMTTAEEKIQQLEFEVTELKQELATFKNQ